jgi:hypothetical protein
MRPRLRSFEHAWTEAAFDAIYPEPPESHLPHGIRSMPGCPLGGEPGRFFDHLLASIPLEQAVGLRLTLWLVALSPLFMIRRFGTIASIAPEERTRVLERLVTSPSYVVRQLAMSFKAVATLLYVQSPAVRKAMGTPVRPALAASSGEELVSGEGLVSAARLTSRGKVEGGGSHEHAA